MEQVIRIRYSRRSLLDIDCIERYIASKGYPETAVSYGIRILTHIQTLRQFPLRNNRCKYPAFYKRGFYCAIFEKTYVVVYRMTPETVQVMRVIHGRRLNY